MIASPCREEPPPKDCIAFTRSNISIIPQKQTGGETLGAKAAQILALPALVSGQARAMRSADAIHVRCPGNLGLLGCVLAPLFSPYLVAKYAGQWNGYRGEPWTVRLQRALLRSRWWHGPVTVYGRWPFQPQHVIPFFTSMMSAEQVEQAVEVASRKQFRPPLRVLFSGRLAPSKRVAALLDAVKIVTDAGIQLDVVIVGDGSEQETLRSMAARLGIQESVKFIGALPFESALEWYEWAHCLVLPSAHSEGWPKVIAEGMCHGVLCIAVDHGQVSAMLEGRGIVLKSGTPQEIADALTRAALRPEECSPLTRRASLWARQFSLEGLREALAELLTRQWNVDLRSLRATPSPEYGGVIQQSVQ
jgi:glycosyltransferase involved in cell wall biosynthesis